MNKDYLVKCPKCKKKAEFQTLSNSIKCLGNCFITKYQFLTKFAATNLVIISELTNWDGLIESAPEIGKTSFKTKFYENN